MSEPSTIDEFLDLARKSGVVEDKRLDAYLDKLRTARSLPTVPGQLAGFMVRDGVLTHFQAEQFLLGKWRRFTIGKYRVLERLGAGGMGSVYLCEHKFMRRRAAVKVLPIAKAEDPACLERFYREARAVAALDHPNIVRAYDIDQDDNLHFLVMEYVDGISLQDLVKKHGPLDITRAAHYIRQAAVGLQHAHQVAGLVHRDIKPANVLVDRLGGVKVLDMGLARFFHDEEDILTQKYEESILGTADYLAPEQALDSHTVDIRADIYGLGATFYFLLTGSTPFAEGTVAQKLIWHQIRTPRPVRSLRPDVPDGLVAVLEKMMAKDPNQRYKEPEEVVVALAPWTQRPIAPPPEKEMPHLSPAITGIPGTSLDFPALSSSTSANARTMISPIKVDPGEPTPVPPMNPPAPGYGLKPRIFPEGPTAFPKAFTTPPPQGPPLDPRKTKLSNPPGEQLDQGEPSLWNPFGGTAPDPAPAPLEPPPVKAPLPKPLVGKKLPGFLFLGGLAILLGVILVVVFGLHHKPTPPTIPGVRVPAILTVNRSGMADSYRTVHEALLKAAAGDRILVQDDSLEEVLVLDDGRAGKEVTIEAAVGDKRVLWKCPPSPPDGKFVSLANISGIHLKGFIFDGQGHVQDLITIRGQCPGLVLDDLQLQGFSRGGVALWNCTGLKDKEIVLKDLRLVTDKPADWAVSFNSDTQVAIPNRHLIVRDCRFEGPFLAAVRIASEVENVRLFHNRFFQPLDGLVYDKGTPRFRITLTVEGNTFDEVKGAALHFLGMPMADWKSEVQVKNNLFARTGVLLQEEEPFDEMARNQVFPHRAGNVRDQESKEANLSLEAQVITFAPLPTDPAKNSEFLHYPLSSPLNTAGIDKTPVGVPPASDK